MNTLHLHPLLFGTLLTAFPCAASPVEINQANHTFIDALVSEGVLSPTQADHVLARLREDSMRQAEVTPTAPAPQRLRFFGDLRFRFEDRNMSYQDNPSGRDEQSRYRLRLRGGATYQLSDHWSIALRLDTGKAANTSNVDFGNNTRRDGFGLNVGVATVLFEMPELAGVFDRSRFWIGKHHLPFFTTGIAGFWNVGDVTGEGLSQELRATNVLGDWDLTLRGGEYLQRVRQFAGEGGKRTEIDYLLMAQAEFSNQSANDGVVTGFKLAPTFVTFLASDHPGLPSGDAFIETDAPDGANYNDLASFILPAELAFRIGRHSAAVFATFGHNFEGRSRARRFLPPGAEITSAMSNFYNAGIRLGAPGRRGASITAEYRYIGAGAHTGALNHPDFNGGRNNARGPALSASFAFTDYLVSTVSYFRSSAVTSEAGGFLSTGGTSSDGLGFRRYETLQLDLQVKF
ncbi:MAG TPA: hypothetical protein VGA56_18840 [Opitutaceae bacterium]